MFILPTVIDEDNYSFECDLEGVGYLFSLKWNERASAWFMSLSLIDGTELAMGIKLTSGVIPCTWLVGASALTGRLFVFDSSGTDDDPGRDDLLPEGRCQLVYFEKTEFEAIEASDDPESLFQELGLAP